jgi:hypothetical protein
MRQAVCTNPNVRHNGLAIKKIRMLKLFAGENVKQQVSIEAKLKRNIRTCRSIIRAAN